MEKSLDKHMNNTMNNHGVIGMLCADKNGFCLGVKGEAVAASSGSITAIAAEAENILPEEGTPIVSLETTSTNMLIKSHLGYTTAIYKRPS